MIYESQEEHDHYECGEATMIGESGMPNTMNELKTLQDEFENETYFSENALGGIELRDRVFKALENAYNRGVEDSLSKVVEKKKWLGSDKIEIADGYNQAITETIDNISKLKTNK